MSAGEQLWNCTTGSGGVNSSSPNCYNTTIDASQIVFGLAINSGIGILCYIGFVLWRGEFRVYFNRLVSPYTLSKQRPPPLKLGGHHQIWSWLIPVFTLPDGDLLRVAGLDALVAQRVLGFGCLALLPLAFLGIAVLLPINYTSYVPAVQTSVVSTSGEGNTTSSSAINDQFLRMTMSAVPFGSNLLLVHFFFTYIYIAWVCWLMVQYYKEFISLRQAHDHSLFQTTELGRRNSLLEGGHSSGSKSSSKSMQISHALRLSMQRSSGANGCGSGGSGLPLDGSERHISVRFSNGVSAGGGSTGDKVLQLGSGSVGERGAEGEGHTTTSIGSRPRLSGDAEEQFPPPMAGATERPSQKRLGENGLLPTDSSVGLRERFSSKPQVGASPFDQASSGKVFKMPGAVSRKASRPNSWMEPDDSSSDSGGGGSPSPEPDLEQAAASAGSPHHVVTAGGLEWDELAESLPLVASADAAQFYTVLIIDAPIEEFTYSHTDSPWVWHMPTKLVKKRRLSLESLTGVVTTGKALARLTSVKERQRLEHRHRRMQVAEESFTDLFGEDFDRIVPLHNPADVDGVMTKWWNERAKLDRLRYQQQRLTSEQAELKAAEAEHQRELKQQIAALEQQIGQLEEEDGQQQAVAAAGRLPAHQQVDIEQPAAAGPEQPRQQPQQVPGQQPEAGDAKSTGWKAVVCCGRGGGGQTASSRAASMPPAKRQKRLKLVATQLDKVTTQIEATEELLATLQSDFEEAQLVAAEALPAPCFFATFHTAQAAAQAARLNLNPLHERMMRSLPAPAPNNVNYTTLLHSWSERGTRPTVVAFFVGLMILFPIGVFAGVCGTIVSAACGGNEGSTNGSWFCSDSGFASFLRNIISSTLPSILLSVWQAIVMPIWFYNCAQAEATHVSFSALDLRCAHWFFLHDVLNVFLGGMLGGSIVWGLRAVINEPGQFFVILGQAAPASSNFFINYVSYRALAMAMFRLFFPHAAVFGGILKWLHIVPKPKTDRDREAAGLPINCRWSRDLGVLQLTVFVVCLAYAIVSPLIVPFGLLYFIVTWPVWRYQMLYVYQSHYDCQGQFWIYCAHRIIICLGIMSSFTAAVLATKGAYAQGLVLFFTTLAFLWWFDTYLTMRYDHVVDQVPAVGFLLAPRARVDDRLYVAPPMRPAAAGWTPEWGKAWIGYGAPRYGY